MSILSSIDEACRSVVLDVDDAVACAVVDLEAGTLMGVHVASAYPSQAAETLTEAAKDIFLGKSREQADRLLSPGQRPEGHHFHEFHVTSEHNHHFAKTLHHGRAVIMLVTKKTSNIGMGWAQVRATIPIIEDHLAATEGAVQ